MLSPQKTKNPNNITPHPLPERPKASPKTHPIRKKSLKKKSIKQSPNLYQRILKQRPYQPNHVLNFYNILCINEKAIRNQHHDESLIKTQFYYKNIKKIEVMENYLSVQLNDNHSLASDVSQAIIRYKEDADERFRRIGNLLEEIERRVKFTLPESARGSAHLAAATTLIDSLGNTPFISKISPNRLIISKAMMQLFGYDSEDFIIECLRFKTPLFEGFSCEAYYNLTIKTLENLNLLLELLEGRIPMCTFLELSYYEYNERIQSKNNMEYQCRMSLSVPMHQVTIIRVVQVLSSKESQSNESSILLSREFKQYSSQIRDRQVETLQHLIALPINALPENRYKVADYIDRTITDDEISKSVLTE